MAEPTTGVESAARHAELSELFAEAIELSRDERTAFVAKVRARDATLADELDELLAADDDVAPALRTAGLQPTPMTMMDAAVGLRPSRQLAIPGYRIGARLGEGGMGTVYAAEQESPRRPVAIKVLHAASGPALQRFWTEAAIMARLDHPGIARVLEAGEAEGHPFIAMEHVDGATLDEHVRAAKASLAVRVSLFAAMCDAVHHAHVNGVIHRDLKPKNVMVRPDGRVVVLDFGIARAGGMTPMDSAVSEDPVATRAGELMGTPVYMSPEQARLRADEVDARSDVYSLGVVLHELVAGELPYPARDVPIAAIPALVCEQAPRDLTELGHDRDLAAIAQTALAKEPEQRYQSAAALADDVRRWLDGRAVSVRTPGTFEQLARFARRRPLAAIAAAGSIAVVIAFAAVVTHLWLAAKDAQHAAEAAGEELAARNATLLLDHARATVGRDPTEALQLLDELHAPIDPLVVGVIADEAYGRGAAAHVLAGHTDEVHWVDQLRDGRIVTAGYDGAVRVWEAPYATSRLVFAEAHGRVHVAVASPDGTEFAVGGDAGALHVIDRDGRARQLFGHAGDVERIVWAGDWLVTADDRGVTLAWRRGQAPSRPLIGARTKIEVLAFSEDGTAVVGGEEAGQVWVWDLEGDRVRSFALHAGARAAWVSGDRVAAVAANGDVQRWSPDPEPTVATRVACKRAAFAGFDVAVLAGQDGTVVRVDRGATTVLGGHATKVRGLAIDAEGRRIATGSEDGLVQVWDRATGRHLTLRGHRQRIRRLVFARGNVLLSSDGEGTARVWPLDAVRATFFDDHQAPVEHVAVSADGRRAVSSDASGAIIAEDLATGASRDAGKSATRVVALAVANGIAITGDADGGVAWWTSPDAPVRRTVPGAVRAIAASPDGTRVAVASAAGPIALFDGTGAPLGTLAGHDGGTEALAFDGTGLLASGGQDRSIRLWRDTAAVIALDGPTGDTHLVAFAPGGATLVSAGDDGIVRAWTIRGGTADPASHRVVGEHAGSVTAVGFDAAGAHIASTARDTRLELADLATGTRERATTPHRGAVAAAIDATGRALFAGETGDVDRWSPPALPASVPVNQGTTAAVALPDGRLLLGGADGSLRAIGTSR